jgi:hypothetical protein
MIEKIELSPKAEALLMTASICLKGDDGQDLWLINRTLGMLTWRTKGKKGARADVAELYRNGLVEEWFNPWVPPLYLTKVGKQQHAMRMRA